MTRHIGLIIAGAALAGGVGFVAARPVAAQAGRNVWSGVYNDAQANRGKQAYIGLCAECHQEGLQGADLAPALKGEEFILRWAGQSVFDVTTMITARMPVESPGSLTRQETADIFAYILQVNRAQAGSDELSADAAAQKMIAVTARPAP